jgi:hypothetical protein
VAADCGGREGLLRHCTRPAEQGHIAIALQHAAVVGHVFWDQVLAAIDPGAVDTLPVLLRKQFIVHHDMAAFDDTQGYAFQHHLLHQVTYDTMLKEPRRQGHERVGAFWSTRAEVASPQQVNAAACRALTEAPSRPGGFCNVVRCPVH